jgi:hypothetical protein
VEGGEFIVHDIAILLNTAIAGQWVARDAAHIPAVVARLDRAIQLRRGFSNLSLAPLEYWITRFRG